MTQTLLCIRQTITLHHNTFPNEKDKTPVINQNPKHVCLYWMAKDNPKATANRHMKARITYLDKAARYLVEQQAAVASPTDATEEPVASLDRSRRLHFRMPQGLPILLASHLRSVSLKTQNRLSQDLKRRYCKVCNTPLIIENTSDQFTENLSKGSKKPHADVLVISCRTCGTKKRFPVGAQRQMKKAERLPAKEAEKGASKG